MSCHKSIIMPQRKKYHILQHQYPQLAWEKKAMLLYYNINVYQ